MIVFYSFINVLIGIIKLGYLVVYLVDKILIVFIFDQVFQQGYAVYFGAVLIFLYPDAVQVGVKSHFKKRVAVYNARIIFISVGRFFVQLLQLGHNESPPEAQIFYTTIFYRLFGHLFAVFIILHV